MTEKDTSDEIKVSHEPEKESCNSKKCKFNPNYMKFLQEGVKCLMKHEDNMERANYTDINEAALAARNNTSRRIRDCFSAKDKTISGLNTELPTVGRLKNDSLTKFSLGKGTNLGLVDLNNNQSIRTTLAECLNTEKMCTDIFSACPVINFGEENSPDADGW